MSKNTRFWLKTCTATLRNEEQKLNLVENDNFFEQDIKRQKIKI